MRVKVDENLPNEVAEILREAGHDADTVIEEHLGGRPDAAITAVVQKEERIFVTLDLDFSDIRVYPPEQYGGLIVMRPRQQDKFCVLEMTKRLIPLLTYEDPRGHLWIMEEGRVRIRP